MNLTSLIGYASAFLVLYFGIYKGASNPQIFIDISSIIIVIGGTVSVSLIIYPLRKLLDISDFIFFKVVFRKKFHNLNVAKDVLDIYFAQNYEQEIENRKKSLHPFLVESLYLLRSNDLSANELNSIFTERISNVKKQYSDDTKTLVTLAKFPPAFGLLGSVTGIISMMTGLGAGGAEQIGPAMAVTLVTTFWGIAISNLFILPLADHAARIRQMKAFLSKTYKQKL